MKFKSHIAVYSICGFFILLVDQWLKTYARANQTFTYYLTDPYLGWEYFGNPGIAFSLPISNTILVIVTPLIILGLFIVLTKHYKRKLFSLGIILIIAGAISNLVDRILFELTIDYIRIFTSIFNLADISIVAGAVLLLFSSPKQKKVTGLTQ
jgi:signal peptidase II